MSVPVRQGARALLAIGIMVLAPWPARATGTPPGRSPILRDGRGADEESVRPGVLHLPLGERRVLLTLELTGACAVPAGSVDVTRIGSRTLVLTPRKPGTAELRLTGRNDAWTVPLVVQELAGPREEAAGADADAAVTRGPAAWVSPGSASFLRPGVAPVTIGVPLVAEPILRARPLAARPQVAPPARPVPLPVVLPAPVVALEAGVDRTAGDDAAVAAEASQPPIEPAGPPLAAIALGFDEPPAAALTPIPGGRTGPQPLREVAADDPVPRLSGILRTAQGPVALLDGRPAAVGDRVGPFRVERVEADRVVLSQGGRWIELGLPRR